MAIDMPLGKNVLGLLVFDLDGTLVDSVSGNTAAYVAAAGETFNVAPHKAASQYTATMGQPLEEQASALAASLHIGPAMTNAMVEAFWKRAALAQPGAYPDALRALPRLKEAGYLIAVSTGLRTDLAIHRLRTTGLFGSVRFTLGSDVDSGLKGREHFRWLAATLGTSLSALRRQCLFIGDASADVEIAVTEGVGMVLCCRTSQLASTRSRANLVVNNLNQLVAALREPNADWMRVSRLIDIHPR